MFDNYFELFQLPIKLPIDNVLLNERYQQLQKQYHPDNFSLVSDSEKAAIMQKSANINTAYQTLKNPISGAEYILTLQGKGIDIEHKTIRDPNFLMIQFELRERLDDLENQLNWDVLEQFYTDVMSKQRVCYQQLLQYIDNQQWENARNEIYQLRYFTRLIEQIELLQEKQFHL